MRFLFTAWLAAAMAAPGVTADVQIHITTPENRAGKAVVEAVGIDTALSQSHLLAVPGELTISAPKGTVLRLRATSPGLWAADHFVSVVDKTNPVEIGFLPAAVLSARVAVTQQAEVKVVTVEGQQSSEARRRNLQPIPAFRTDCGLSADRWSCLVPAGRIDFAVRVPGYAPLYFWDRTIASAKKLDLGVITLRKGSSLSGFAQLEDNSRPPTVTVTLRPDVGDDTRFKDEKTFATMRVKANEQGFFQFVGVNGGAYILSACASGMACEERPVVVEPARESRLRDRIVLTPPAEITVQANPPVDPWDRQWRLTLSRSAGNNHHEILDSGEVGADGIWRSKPLPKGRYLIELARSPQGTWAVAEKIITESTTVIIDVPLLKVSGSLSQGGSPVQGFILFGGENAAPSVPVFARDGRFKTLLPRPANDRWETIEIVADGGRIRHHLDQFSVEVDDSDREVRIDLEIPATRLVGEVTNAEGRPVNATVWARAPANEGQMLRVETDASGAFEITGLRSGSVSLRAETAAEQSPVIEVEINEAPPGEYVRLILQPKHAVQGVVRSSGGPVSGARLWIWPAETRMSAARMVTTLMDGTFSFSVPPDSHRVLMVLTSPGNAVRLLSAPVGANAEIEVQPHRGRVVIDFGNASLKTTELMRDGARFSLGLLTAIGVAVTEGANGGRVVIEQLEPGSYKLCFEGELDCSAGYLPPWGDLALTRKTP